MSTPKIRVLIVDDSAVHGARIAGRGSAGCADGEHVVAGDQIARHQSNQIALAC